MEHSPQKAHTPSMRQVKAKQTAIYDHGQRRQSRSKIEGMTPKGSYLNQLKLHTRRNHAYSPNQRRGQRWNRKSGEADQPKTELCFRNLIVKQDETVPTTTSIGGMEA
ncbi:hypothetical protein Nepgr_023081 [Nepenthes gracilis]|uniref:Uncharacterized protein n=1 Tax=Nepenthes gracilis TaxID=150966 RepID=A0AAD3XYP9_NEPGR|nr:hypothetical protein Nepgr_023081 [Nepenthes gracilis]